MVRQKSKIWLHFNQLNVKNKKITSCKYCNHTFKIPNSFRMERHIVNVCECCPAELKKTFQNKHKKIRKSVIHSEPDHDSDTKALSTPKEYSAPSVYNQLSSEENEELREMMSLAIIVTTRSFSMFEHRLWREFFKKLRPEFELPTRKTITSAYISLQQEKMLNDTSKGIGKSNVLHLQCDGWSNIRSEGTIIKFVINKPKPVVVRSIELRPGRNTIADRLSEEIVEILETYGASRFCVLIGDNADHMQSALDKISEQFQNVVPLACIAHTLNLLLADIKKVTHVAELIDDVDDLVNTINNSQVLNELFLQFNRDLSLENVCETGWGTTEKRLTNVLKCKSALQSIGMNPKVGGLGSKFINLVFKERFWKKVEQLNSVLVPIADVIAKIEGNESAIHNVYSWFGEMQIKVWDELSKLDILSKDEQDDIKISFLARKKAAVRKMHLAAVVLNPLDQGASLLPSEELEAVEYIHSLYERTKSDILNRNEETDAIVTELASYKSKTDLWSKEFLWKNATTLSPLVWWKSFFSRTALGQVAIAVLSAPVTSTVTEKEQF